METFHHAPEIRTPNLQRQFAFLMFLNYGAQGAFLPLFSRRLDELGFAPIEIGWSCATQPLASLIGPIVVGQLADRYFAAQRCLSVCAFLAGILFWIMAGLTEPWSVFGLSLAIWLVLGPANTLCATMCFHHLLNPERDFGSVRLWGTIGWVTASWIVPVWLYVADVVWNLVLPTESTSGVLGDIFRLAGVISFALAAFALTLPHTPPRHGAETWFAPVAALQRLRGRSFRVYFTCSFGLCMTLPFMMQLAPLLLKNLDVPDRWIAPALTTGQTMEVTSLALLPMLLLRFSVRGTMLIGATAWTMLLTALMIGRPTWLVISSLSLNGLFICCFVVAGQVFVNSRAPADVRASAQALLTFVNGLGMLAGNLLVGWVRHAFAGEFQPTFAVGACIAACLTMVLLLAFRPRVERLMPGT
jgi:MFS family permease